MRRCLIGLAVLLVTLLAVPVAVSAPAYAAAVPVSPNANATCDAKATKGDPFYCACHQSTTTTAAIGCDKGNGADTVSGGNGILKKVQVIIAVVGGIAAVILILVSGFKFVNSEGDAQKVANARTSLIYTLIGITIIILANAIIAFVLKGVA